MTDAVREFIKNATANVHSVRPAQAYAPSNIALSKYWGKRDAALNLPRNSSISISLGAFGSHTEIGPAQSGKDEVLLDGAPLDLNSAFAVRTLRFADLFRAGKTIPLRVETRNTIPTAAGLASSASGFAALTSALCAAFDLGLSETQMSRIARLGSGSATRSFWHGFVKWPKGEAADGWDSHGIHLDHEWDDLRVAIIPVDKGPKPFSSRDGMIHTANTSPLFPAWPAQAEEDCAYIEQAILERDLTKLGHRVETNALAMHATMIAARPPLAYLTEKSWGILGNLWQARADGLEAYATMDAGPNVKLIFLAPSTEDVRSVFGGVTIVSPFAAEVLAGV